MRDAIDLSSVTVFNSPQDVAEWPVTVAIRSATMSPAGISIDAEIPLSWDYHVPGWGNAAAGDDGNVLYTVWAIVRVGGAWLTSGFIQMYKGRASTGAPILTEWREWAYDRARWGALCDYNPAAGDEIGVFVTAGDARGESKVTSARQRSNVVVLALPAPGGSSRATAPAEPSPAEPAAPAAPAAPAEPAAPAVDLSLVLAMIATVHAQQASDREAVLAEIRALRQEVTDGLKKYGPALVAGQLGALLRGGKAA